MNEIRSAMGKKIPANMFDMRLVVGEGLQTLPDKALPCPYAISPMRPYARNLFSEEGLPQRDFLRSQSLPYEKRHHSPIRIVPHPHES
jgi:hypothetical protein